MVARPLWALVAIRSSAGKRRLSSVLDDAERRELVMAMAEDVLMALTAAMDVDGVALTTADPDLFRLGQRLGVRIIPEEGEGGLNEALTRARSELLQDGVASLLVVHGDVPDVTPADIALLVRSGRSAVTMVRASKDGGTNALLLTPPDAIPFQFGADSCAAHVTAAETAGVAASIVVVPGLSRDIDDPDDLAELAHCRRSGRASQFARRYALT